MINDPIIWIGIMYLVGMLSGLGIAFLIFLDLGWVKRRGKNEEKLQHMRTAS